MYCFDTDVLSAAMRREPKLSVLRRLAWVPDAEQSTTAITLGELIYGAMRRRNRRLAQRIAELVTPAMRVFAFDRSAAEVFGSLKAELEAEGHRLDEPDLRIGSICIARDLTLASGNIRHFSRVPRLRVENWLED